MIWALLLLHLHPQEHPVRRRISQPVASVPPISLPQSLQQGVALSSQALAPSTGGGSKLRDPSWEQDLELPDLQAPSQKVI